jgi:hypothetical protein
VQEAYVKGVSHPTRWRASDPVLLAASETRAGANRLFTAVEEVIDSVVEALTLQNDPTLSVGFLFLNTSC